MVLTCKINGNNPLTPNYGDLIGTLSTAQVDLGRLTFLTVVGTQGRYARNSGNEFTRAYRLNYSRDGLLWKPWRNRLGNAVRGRGGSRLWRPSRGNM